jgi:SAM-dependent methyltransferase
VDAYVRSRPSYPLEVIDLLRSECGLQEHSVVADVGSGTGIFTGLLLAAGCTVFAVEPNAPMRDAAELRFGGHPWFHSVEGTAENTGLTAACVDIVTATQAFHWFDPKRARLEFSRILRLGGWAIVIWNERLKTADPFHVDYERLLQTWGTDYASVDHATIKEDDLKRFYSPQICHRREFENGQTFDWEGLKNRLLSSSFAPNVGSPNCAPMLAELEEIFQRRAIDGTVEMRYRTVVYYGRLT